MLSGQGRVYRRPAHGPVGRGDQGEVARRVSVAASPSLSSLSDPVVISDDGFLSPSTAGRAYVEAEDVSGRRRRGPRAGAGSARAAAIRRAVTS